TGNDPVRVRWDVVRLGKQGGVLSELGCRAGRYFGRIKPARNAQAWLRERIIIPPDAANDGDVAGDKWLGFEPLPAKGADSIGQLRRVNRVAVASRRPKF